MVDQTMVHFSSDGWMLNKDSEEAVRQMELERQESDARVSMTSALERLWCKNINKSGKLKLLDAEQGQRGGGAADGTRVAGIRCAGKHDVSVWVVVRSESRETQVWAS